MNNDEIKKVNMESSAQIIETFKKTIDLLKKRSYFVKKRIETDALLDECIGIIGEGIFDVNEEYLIEIENHCQTFWKNICKDNLSKNKFESLMIDPKYSKKNMLIDWKEKE